MPTPFPGMDPYLEHPALWKDADRGARQVSRTDPAASLRGGAEEPRIDLRTLLGQIYDAAGYDLSVDYRSEPVPALSAPDAGWAKGLLARRRTT